uniref:FXNA-like protease n=1 Tax=Strigamia maritima TaxID=126957 RepID=T1IR32_STRMM
MAQLADEAASNLRPRNRSKTALISQSPFAHIDDDVKKFSNSSVRERVYLVIFTFYASILIVIHQADLYLPPARTVSDVFGKNSSKSISGLFTEERARTSLLTLTSIGPRIVGSYENEVLAVEFLLREINLIKLRSQSHFNFEIDVQKPSGSFNLGFQDGFTSYYSKVKNILVKLEPKNGAEHALLVNCHYDTALGSPGASDDAVNCAIMLEILNVIAQKSGPLKHSIIFNFNGAEENVLQAAHGFITQHPWAKPIRAFINLEACGSGGREIVFQAGPENPWLVRAYGEQVPYPFASVMGQEIFASGIIPGDTDFRIYRDYGHIPGLDLAYVDNGYVYHTKYDKSEYIPPGTIQRTGDNVLALIHHLASSPILADPGSERKGNLIFFDVLGFYLIMYSELCGVILNLVTAFLAVVALYISMRAVRESGLAPTAYFLNLSIALVVVVLSWFASMCSVVLIATFINSFDSTMSWFSNHFWILALYCTPTLAVQIAVHRFGSNVQKKFLLPSLKDNGWFLESLYFEATRLIYVALLVLLTILHCRSSFLLMTLIIFPTLIRTFVIPYNSRKTRSPGNFISTYMASQIPSCIVVMYAAYCVFYTFVPIMGRAGAVHNPDVFVGILMSAATIVSTSFMMTLVQVVRSVNRVLSILMIAICLSVFAVCFTTLGFPYSANPVNPTPQRYIVVHIHRTFHNHASQIRKEDSGFWVLPMDYNGPKIITPFVPELKSAHFVLDDCPTELYCGMPYYFPVISKLGVSHYVLAGKPKFHTQPKITLVSQKAIGLDRRRLTFNLTGPTHMGVFLSPSIDTLLADWSFADGVPGTGPRWGDRSTYFVYYSRGEDPPQWSFWIDLKLLPSQKKGQPMLDIVMTSHHLHGPDRENEELSAFVRKFPNWTFPASWSGTYQSWVYHA